MTQEAAMKRLLRPENIAVIGGRFADAVIKQCDFVGFKGQIYPVNPRRESMQGRRCFASVKDLPVPPDAVFLAVDNKASILIVKDLAELGAGGVVVYAAGFAEHDAEGERMQVELLNAKGGMALVGPNCYGMLNYLDGVALWPDEHGGKAVSSGAAIVLQSGNIGVSITMQQRSLPLAYLISVGNQADLEMHDYIEAFLEDERVTCIGLHIEGLKDVQAFSKAALKALHKGVPIVVLKTGTSNEGQKLTFSHTSSLSGSDDLYSAMFARYGVARTRTIPEFLETLKLLSTVGSLATKKIASISCSGGEAAHIADLASKLGLEFPLLIPTQEKALFNVLGDKVALSNPLDYHTYIWNNETAQQACFAAMMLGEQTLTIKILDYPKSDLCDISAWDKTARAFMNALKERNSKGVVVSTLSENLPEQTRDWLLSEGVAPMQGLEDCLLAVNHAHELFLVQQKRAVLKPLQAFSLSTGIAKNLNEFEAKKILEHYGFKLPKARVLSKNDDLAMACIELGFPLVLKVLSADILHKSDLGGVELNLQSVAGVEAALTKMQDLGQTFLLEQMLETPITELILGISRDEQFGLSITLGVGGLLVELLKDSQNLLLPLNIEDVKMAIQKLKIYPVFCGYRGQPKVHLDALIDAVMKLVKLADSYKESLLELDINPLFVYKDSVVAADAVIRLLER